MGLAHGMSVAVSAVLKLPDPSSPLRGKLGIQRRVAWSEPVSLADVKAIGAATGTKVNDVLVAAMTGALRHYMQGARPTVDGLAIRAVVPVDLRPPKRALELGNHFGLAYLDLPVGLPGPLDRLQRVKQAMDAIKHSPEAALFMGIVGIFGQTPKQLEQLWCLAFLPARRRSSMTNVAGPRQPLYLAGCDLDRMMFWVPHTGSLGMGISILSYNGLVTWAWSPMPDWCRIPNRSRWNFNASLRACWPLRVPRPTLRRRPSQALPRSRREHEGKNQLDHAGRNGLAEITGLLSRRAGVADARVQGWRWVAFFTMEGTWLSLFPREELAADVTVSAVGSGFIGITLAHNVASKEEVDSAIAVAAAAGARLVKTPQTAAWGGYSGYFADPDGYLWEVAYNPFLDLT